MKQTLLIQEKLSDDHFYLVKKLKTKIFLMGMSNSKFFRKMRCFK